MLKVEASVRIVWNDVIVGSMVMVLGVGGQGFLLRVMGTLFQLLRRREVKTAELKAEEKQHDPCYCPSSKLGRDPIR